MATIGLDPDGFAAALEGWISSRLNAALAEDADLRASFSTSLRTDLVAHEGTQSISCVECGANCAGTVCETCRSSRLVTAYSGNPAVAGIDHASGPGRATYTISSEKWTAPVSVDDIMKAFGENPWRAIDALGLNLESHPDETNDEFRRRMKRECGPIFLDLAPASFAGIPFPTAPVMINTREDKPMPTETGTIPLARNVATDLETKAHPDALARARRIAELAASWGIVADRAGLIGAIEGRSCIGFIFNGAQGSVLVNCWESYVYLVDSKSEGSSDPSADAIRSALLEAGTCKLCRRVNSNCRSCSGTGVVSAEAAQASSESEPRFWSDWEQNAREALTGTAWRVRGRTRFDVGIYSREGEHRVYVSPVATVAEAAALIRRALGIPDSQAPVLSSADGRSLDSSGDRRASGQSVPGSPSSAEDRERPEPSRVSAALINMRALFTGGDDISTEAHRWLDRIRRTMWNWDKRAGVLRINGDTIVVHHDSTIDDVERMLTTSSPSAGEVHASGSCAEPSEGGVICSYVPIDSEEEWGCGVTLNPGQYETGPCGTTCVYCVQRIRIEAVCERETVRETPEPERRHPHTPEWPSGSEHWWQV